jgi:hypothetical protein
MGSGGTSAASIWGPFAGYGQRGQHASWLLNRLGNRAEDLRAEVTRRFQQRQIPSAQVESRVLTGKGIDVERRPYNLIRRGVTTEGLYIARFGHDLFISRVTYAKGPVSTLRVIVLALMLVLQLFMTFGYTAALSASMEDAVGSFSLLGGYSGGNVAGVGALLCCIGPLGSINMLLLILAAFHMLYHFLIEKDPLALLRTPLNEFQIDDTIALEKAVEETVRQSMDAIGIDATLLTPSETSSARRRLF